MNIGKIIERINVDRKLNIPTKYYTYIAKWRCWWEGYFEEFHQYKEVNEGKRTNRKLYGMKMAKKVCEDWASLLLNEKTKVVMADDTTQKLVDSVFQATDFWQQANQLVERAFALGGGAILVRIKDLLAKSKEVSHLEFVGADCIIPLTVKQGRIVDVCFASVLMDRGKQYIYCETHILEPEGYIITNEYYNDDNGAMIKTDLPADIAPEIHTKSQVPLFAIVKPNLVNNLDETTGLGLSIFANAIDQLMGVDLAYNNFNKDLKLGGKKVFYNDTMIQRDSDGKAITPDDVCQQLFHTMGDAMIEGKTLIHEWNPDLRVIPNVDAIQAQLDYLSFKVGLGTKHYQFNAGSIVTATQYMGDKQELIQNASKHYINIEKAVRDVVRAILDIAGMDPDTEVTVIFDDSVIIDKESERLRDQTEQRDGIMSKLEYRMKWYGEDEATAKKMLAQVGSEQPEPEEPPLEE